MSKYTHKFHLGSQPSNWRGVALGLPLEMPQKLHSLFG